ncbi:DUF559 domain-containing protein [Bacillus luteus]|uniref:DUF559 domain-containing protein n=2 Tax=Alkalicoccus luteus TaxID=1237094 RepID=A0A969TV08_9BACI|nr:DUF559 domain-containing protein [Alkalicoccus luteus]
MMMRLIAHEDHFIKEYTSFDPSLQINLFLQKPIEVGNKTYRADFLIKVIALNKPYNFIVECDGHEFHEKTKEQALRDKQRGRSLQKQGYQVIRFTGSEIYRNASTAAAEVFEMIKTMTGLEKEIERIIKEDFEY